MPVVTHLKSLQALELAIRLGSLKAAADRLGITPAAVGQRIRALEDYLGEDLLMRGRSGLQPTAELSHALGDLQTAFAALERATEALDFQRVSEIQIVADTDWADLWLAPRLSAFRAAHPNILLCLNGVGDVPLRLGAPDVRVVYGDGRDEPLFTDVVLPVSGPDILRRIGSGDPINQMEGMPLLHLKAQLDGAGPPGWVEWFGKFGQRESGPDRGVRYQHARLALEAVRQDVGCLVCGLSLVEGDLEQGHVVNPFPMSQHLAAPHPYRLKLRQDVEKRPQLQRFAAWLRTEASETRRYIEKVTAQA
jgi:LysR family transcriptional regulator, glycine cleavage system transcriptional activator